MPERIKIPDSIGARTEYKRKFNPGEMYRAFVLIPPAAARLIGNKKSKLVDPDFACRIWTAIRTNIVLSICIDYSVSVFLHPYIINGYAYEQVYWYKQVKKN